MIFAISLRIGKVGQKFNSGTLSSYLNIRLLIPSSFAYSLESASKTNIRLNETQLLH